MIFKKLKIKNFGIYNGSHIIDFCPKTKKPIVLITALNGSGKTTILTAIQIVLYGKLAPVIRVSKMGYRQYLQSKINNVTDGETSLELDISIYENGKRSTYSVNRCWYYNDSHSDINESFSVKVNNSEERAVTEKWIEFIEGLLPLNIMPLFFFDGEKVEEMASVENSSSMLATGILSLLGMDIVNKLQQDLKIYENRYIVKDNKNLPDPSVLKEYRDNVISLQTEYKRNIQEKALFQAKLEQAKGKLEKSQGEFLKSGGDLYNRREELFLKERQITRQLIEYQETKNQIMAHEGPLLSVKDLLSSVVRQAKNEMAGNEAKIAGKYLEKQHKELLVLLDIDLSKEAIEKINHYFKEKNDKFLKSGEIDYYLDISHATFAELLHLHKEIIPGTSKILKQTEAAVKDLEEEKSTLTELINGLPADTEIQPIKNFIAYGIKIMALLQ
ncbi:MAG: DNA sulfur modification protein DndD [Spirochaetales bacterium]|nr:DNA sulfur modification protein DndD [Spirochaetales bacterium]